MEFTLVSTVFNEAKRLDQTISDLINQTLQPTEIIITDAGSTDGTYEMLKEWSKQSPISIIILQKVRCNVAEGRNIAIKAAKHNIIASMDFGCRYDPKWLESIIEPFEDVQTKVVGGAYSINENEVQTTAAKAEYILKRGYPLRINDSNFIPSSRSIAYRKEVYDNIGGYCEWLTLAADDLIFGMLIKEKGYKIIMVDKPFASWIRHKTSKGFINEAYRYGLGNGEAQVLYSQFAKMFIIKICFILFYLSLLYIIISFSLLDKVLILPLILVVLFSYSFRYMLSYFKSWVYLRSSKYNFFIFLYSLILISKINTGYIRGYIKGFYFASKLQKEEATRLKKLFHQ